MENERKNYLDNIRWITVILVMVYHVIWLMNSQGCISNIGVKGYAFLDGVLYFIYPWFMVLMFAVAGISARYSLLKRTSKEFVKDRAIRLLVPSIVLPITLGWITGMITDYYTDMFKEARDIIPDFIKYIVYVFSGQGPLWFAQQLFIACLVLLLIRKIDKNRKLEKLCDNIPWWGFAILLVIFWASSLILNTPIIEVYRNGIYIFSFLLGYYVFYSEKNLDRLEKARFILVPAAIVLSIGYYFWIKFTIEPLATNDVTTSLHYASRSVLKHPFTNIFAFVTILAVFSIARKCLNFSNGFSRYMTKANFGYYALHLYVLVPIAFVWCEIVKLPIWACYLANASSMIVVTTVLYLIISKIPVVRKLMLGMGGKQKTVSDKKTEKR